MSIAIYPGSFDPVTLGHIDVIKRSAAIVDRLYVGVLVNASKKPLFTIDERVSMLKTAVCDLKNVEVVPFSGLTIDFAHSVGAGIIVRGLRAVTDFEYELQLAQTNGKLAPDIDTIFFTTKLEYAYLSSSIVKEVASYGGDISAFVPDFVQKKINDKINKM